MAPGNQETAFDELDNAIKRGIAYLKRVVNDDGGIPNHSPGEESGAWTTAEMLSTLWQLQPSFDSAWFDRLARYLLHDARLLDGSLPTVHEPPGSIPATAAGIQALLCIDEFPWLDSPSHKKVLTALEEAVQWLILCRNKRWGWGWDRTNSLTTARPLSLTVFALRALIDYYAKTRSGPIGEFLWDGVRYLETCQNHSGGWGLKPGSPSVVGNTGRILKILVSLGVDRKSEQIVKGIGWLERAAQERGAMDVIEEYVDIGDGPASIDIHHNTPFTLLTTLLALRPGSSTILKLTDWFVETQLSDGSWRLRSPSSGKEYAASTWVTVEAISALQKVRALQGSGSGSQPAVGKPG